MAERFKMAYEERGKRLAAKAVKNYRRELRRELRKQGPAEQAIKRWMFSGTYKS